MRWPWVSRVRLEAVQALLEASEERYKELQVHADKLLDSILAEKAEPPEQKDPAPTYGARIKRIRDAATAAKSKK